MIHHPHAELIKLFATAELSAPVLVMVSAHLERCGHCKDLYQKEINSCVQELASLANEANSVEMSSSLNNVFEKIEQSVFEAELPIQKDFKIDISGQSIALPPAFNFLKNKSILWKEFGKSNAISPVITSREGNFYLIYIGAGESVPQHDHSGTEYSYVVAGSYHDGISEFNSGDFTISKSGEAHSPRATSEDGCLVVSWVEGRLNYFTGVFKPLNSLLWWYLHRA